MRGGWIHFLFFSPSFLRFYGLLTGSRLSSGYGRESLELLGENGSPAELQLGLYGLGGLAS